MPGTQRHQKKREWFINPSGDNRIMLQAGGTDDGGGLIDDMPLAFRTHIDLNLRSQVVDVGWVSSGE